MPFTKTNAKKSSRSKFNFNAMRCNQNAVNTSMYVSCFVKQPINGSNKLIDSAISTHARPTWR